MKKFFNSQISTFGIVFLLFGMLILFWLGGWQYLLTIVSICTIIYFILKSNAEVVKNNKKNIIMISSLISYGFYLGWVKVGFFGSIVITVLFIIALIIVLNTILKTDVDIDSKEESLTENIGRNLAKSFYSLSNMNFKMLSKSSVFYFISFIAITLFFGGFSKNNNSIASDCTGAGNENCIESVRTSLTNTGKTILGEQYLGNGRFGVSFMDSQHPGAYNATISTDCKCNITSSNVSTIR